VIQSFVDSWALFHHAYLSGWLIAALLALAGVVLVARDQVFLGVAVAQASVLGITVGIRLGGVSLGAPVESHGPGPTHNLFGGLFAVAGAVLTANRGAAGRESREAVTGWIYLVGASLSVLFVAHNPHGLAEVQHLLASTLIGATAADTSAFTVLLLVSAGVFAACRDRLVLLVTDTEMARAIGLRVDWWNLGLAVWLGIVVSMAIHVSGVIYAFGCLVLPAMAAKHLCSEVRTLFLVAPLLALLGAFVSFVVANHLDYPPGQLAVALLAAMVVVAWTVRRLREAGLTPPIGT
jgi:zinc/manganese transport system permease protein